MVNTRKTPRDGIQTVNEKNGKCQKIGRSNNDTDEQQAIAAPGVTDENAEIDQQQMNQGEVFREVTVGLGTMVHVAVGL